MDTPSTAGSQPQDRKWVTTGPAAEAVQVHPNTLWRWYREGLVKPAAVTAKGQTRWDVDDLRRQIEHLNATKEDARQAKERARKRARERVEEAREEGEGHARQRLAQARKEGRKRARRQIEEAKRLAARAEREERADQEQWCNDDASPPDATPLFRMG